MMELSEATPRDASDAGDSAAAVSCALAALSEMDLLRLQSLARLRARGLPPDIGWADLLHEALVRALDGSRRWPPGVPLLVFLAGVMRSLCDEIWRRRRYRVEGSEEEARGAACPAADPERVLAAGQAVAEIYRLFAGDAAALGILSGLADGLSAEEIRTLHGLSPVEYASARRRMRRTLLRAGLAWSLS